MNTRFLGIGAGLFAALGVVAFNATGIVQRTLVEVEPTTTFIVKARTAADAVAAVNAVNGVINVITKRASETQGTFIQGGGGTEDRSFGAVRYGGKVGDSLHYRFYGKWNEHDGGWAIADAADDYRMARGGFRMDWQPSDCSTFTFQGDFFEGDSGQRYTAALPVSPYQVAGVPSDNGPAGQNILTRYSHRFSDESDWSIQLYWDRTSRPDRPVIYPHFAMDCNTFDLDFQQRFPLCPSHSLIWGFGYRTTRNFTDGNPTIEFDPAVRSFGIISYFVQDQITLSPDVWSLTIGSKFEHNDFSGFEYQPTIRLLYTPDERRTVWTSVSRAVRTPSRMDHDVTVNAPTGAFVPMFAQVLGDPSVESEELMAYELGYRAQPTDEFWWDLALFYHDYDKLVRPVAGAPRFDPASGITYLPSTYANAVSGATYGFELAGTYDVNSCWELQTGYSFLVMDLDGDLAGAVEGESPRNQIYLQSRYDLGCAWELDATGRYVDHLDSLGVPGYLTMDARLAWVPNDHLEVALVGRNLLDGEHPEFTNRSFFNSEVQRGVFGSVSWRY